MSSIIDTSILQRMAEDTSQEVVIKVVELFLRDSLAHIESLQRLDAVQVDQLDTIKDHAHAIKGSASTLGAIQLTFLTKTLEENAKQGLGDEVHGSFDPQLCNSLIEQLPGAYARCKVALEEYCADI